MQKLTAESDNTSWQQEQVNLLYEGVLLAMLLNLLLALLMVAILREVTTIGRLLAWLAVLVISLLTRGSLYFYLQKAGAQRKVLFWLNGYRITALFTAAVWGAGAVILFPYTDVSLQAYMAFVYAGISAAAISTLSVDRVSAFGFLLFMLLPLVFSFLMAGSMMQNSMAIMCALFIMYMSVAAVRMQHNLKENFRLREVERMQNEALHTSEERFRYILDTCPTAARIAQSGGHDVIYSNRQYAVLINRPPGSIQGVDPSAYYVHHEDYEEILGKLERGEQVSGKLVELRIPAQHGEEIKWALASYLPVFYEGKKAVLGWFHDITERIRMEQMKSEFVSIVSHELRTPLTAISGAMGLIEGGMLGELPPQMKEMLSIANRNSQRLSLLINDLLDIEKLSAGRMSFDMKHEEVGDLVVQAIALNQDYGRKRKVGIVLAGDITRAAIRVDKQRFMQIMSNLLSNAIKFSPEHTDVEVSLSMAEGRVQVAVQDRGPGIPESFQGRVFEKFAQADSTDTRQKGGTGLGLAITLELVRAMDGEIGFSSSEMGTNFHFSFPVIVPAGIQDLG